MDPLSGGCRLCLDPFADSFTTIDSPELVDKMAKVFCFTIEPKQGYCSGVCQSCSYAISEFYQFSEKVRQNQEALNGNVLNYDPPVDSKVKLGSVKVETLSDVGLLETTGEACDPMDEISEEAEEELATLDSNITLESIKIETFSDFVLPKTTEDLGESEDELSGEEGSDSGDDEPFESQLKKLPKGRPGRAERNQEDQLFKKYIRMNCDLCGMSAATFPELVNHFKSEHKRRNGYVVCCNKKLFKRCTIVDHIKFHTNPDVFRCEVCGNKFKNKDSLNIHMAAIHPSGGPFKCDQCPQSFALGYQLTQHKERHEKITCLQCNKTLTGKKSLANHMNRMHSGRDRTKVCDICGKTFLNKLYYDRHMQKHRGMEALRWLDGERSFENHMNSVQNEEFQCDICLQKYPHAQALYVHKLTHAELEHECKFCGKKFKTIVSLKEHLATHKSEVL